MRFSTLAEHNLPQLLDEGLCVTVNSDDPAYFGGYLVRNYLELFEAQPRLGVREAWQLLHNGFEASFAPAEAKRAWMRQLDAHFDAAATAAPAPSA